jgi:hypothetical protein
MLLWLKGIIQQTHRHLCVSFEPLASYLKIEFGALPDNEVVSTLEELSDVCQSYFGDLC